MEKKTEQRNSVRFTAWKDWQEHLKNFIENFRKMTEQKILNLHIRNLGPKNKWEK